jgi:hypothetical protein
MFQKWLEKKFEKPDIKNFVTFWSKKKKGKQLTKKKKCVRNKRTIKDVQQ